MKMSESMFHDIENMIEDREVVHAQITNITPSIMTVLFMGGRLDGEEVEVYLTVDLD